MNSVPRIWKELNESSDFVCFHHKTNNEPYFIGYFKSLADSKVLHEHILSYLNKDSEISLDDLYNLIPIAEKEMSSDWNNIRNKILRGYVAIQQGLQNSNCILINAVLSKGRNVTKPEIEFNVEGPKEAFVESLDTNLNLIRKRIPIAKLRIKEIIVGSVSESRLAICYMDGITNEQYVNTCI
ncbi:spore germination protein, partial [Paenibacillus sp. TAF58]